MSDNLYKIRPWLGNIHLSKIYLGNNHLAAAYIGDQLVYGNIEEELEEYGMPFNIFWQSYNYILYRPKTNQKFSLDIYDCYNGDWAWRTIYSYVAEIIFDDNSQQAGFIYNLYGDPLPSVIPPNADAIEFKTNESDTPRFEFNFKKSIYEIQKSDSNASHIGFTCILYSVDHNGEPYVEDEFTKEIEFGTSSGHLSETDAVEWVCNKYGVSDPPVGYPTHVLLTGDFSLNFNSLNGGYISISENRELYVKITLTATYHNEYVTHIYFGVLYFDGMNMGMYMEGPVYNDNNALQIRLEKHGGAWGGVFNDSFHVYYFDSLNYYGGYANLNFDSVSFYSTKYPSSTIYTGYMWRKTIFIVRDKSSKRWMKYDPNFSIVSTGKPSSGDGWISFVQGVFRHSIPEQFDRCIITFLIIYDDNNNAYNRFNTFVSSPIDASDQENLDDICNELKP